MNSLDGQIEQTRMKHELQDMQQTMKELKKVRLMYYMPSGDVKMMSIWIMVHV